MRKDLEQQSYRLWILWGLLLLVGGCGVGSLGERSNGELVRAAGEANRADRRRLAVIEAVLQRSLDANEQREFGEVLAEVVGSPRHSPIIRRRALGVIVDRYPDEAAVWLSSALLHTPEENLHGEILAVLVELADERVLGNLTIALYNTGSGTEDEANDCRQAIERVSVRPLEDVLIEQLADDGPRQVKIAAVSCLVRYAGREKTGEIVKTVAGSDAFSEQLRFWAERFGYVPTNNVRLLLCQLQRASLAPDQLAKLQERVSMLAQREEYVFDVRDSYVLLKADESLWLLGRGQLAGEIAERLGQVSHAKRSASHRSAIDDYAEGFDDQGKLLSYTDLLRIRLLLDALAQPASVSQLRGFLEKDLTDTASEIGGLCLLEEGRVIFREYPAGRKGSDRLYIESEQLMRDSALCLTRWHCHADVRQRAELAGPGVDDVRYADYADSCIVVLTYLSEKKCNIDYLTPAGVVIDLGNY